MAEQRKLAQQAKDASLYPGRVARMKKKSPVDISDMELFFGRTVRSKAVINHVRRTHTYEEESADEDDSTDEEDWTDGEDEDEEPTYWVAPTIQEALPFKPRKMSVGGDLNLPHEILEAILSHLPTLSLIVATGVNMTFRTIAQNSQTLQRNLFLRPTNRPREFVKIEDDRKVSVATQRTYDHGVEDDISENAGSENDADGHDIRNLGGPSAMAYEIAALCPLLVPERDDHVCEACGYPGPRVFCLSRLTPLAEHWANMYLTNPPTKEVVVYLHYTGGYARQYNVSADRTVYCETGVTVAALLDAIYLKGPVEITRAPGWWPGSDYGDMSGDREDTTANMVIQELEEWWAGQDWGCMMGGRMELDLSRTFVDIPGLVVREWNEDSDDCYFRFGDGIRQYQTPTAEEATASEEVASSEEATALEEAPQ
jgi:hypothetical protein